MSGCPWTTQARAVSSRTAAPSAAGAIRPSPSTPTRSRAAPSRAAVRHTARVAGCSTADATTCRPSARLADSRPATARLRASVAPAVNTTHSGSAPARAATSARASSTAPAGARPHSWRLDGLPKRSPSQGSIASRTRGSSGDAAAWSR